MTHPCPRGHQSQSADYCDECGAPIAGAVGGPAPGAAAGSARAQSIVGTPASAPEAHAPSPSANATAAGPPPDATGQDVCPECGTAATGRFCESCGFDLLMPHLAPSVTAANPDGTGTSVGEAPVARSADGASTTSVERASDAAAARPLDGAAVPADPAGNHGAGDHSVGDHAAGASTPTIAPDAEPAVAAPAAPTGAWRVVVTADPDYHARMQVQAQPDAEPVAFPAFCPARRFALEGDQVLIGRRSRSRGIEPEIDLSGPPEDPAVSHMHALLVARPDGGWALVDLDSANGTYVNDGSHAIGANVPTPLSDGDRVHVGAWTTLTFYAPA